MVDTKSLMRFAFPALAQGLLSADIHGRSLQTAMRQGIPTMKLNAATQFAAAAAATCLALPALAAGTWDFSVCNGTTSSAGTAGGTVANGGTANNSYACAANGSTTRDLTVSAWGAISAANNTYGSAFVSNLAGDGFGVGAQSEGGAATTSTNLGLDNDPSSLVPNIIVLKFSSAVILDKILLGWSMNDADLTVMAYTGAGAPSSFIAGKTAGTLTTGGASAGWSLVQNVGDASPDVAYGSSGTNINYSVNGGGVASAYWLISAYNSSFGGGALDSLVDYASLLSVSTRDVSKVAEPGSVALAGMALLALWTTRRRLALRRP